MKPWQDLTRAGRTRRLRAAAEVALPKFGLEGASLTRLTEGSNCSFRAETAGGERFVLRVGEPSKVAEMECLGAEVAWLSALARDTDLRVPRPRLTRDGAPAAEVDLPGLPRPVYVIAYSWLEGRLTGDRFTPADARGMGGIAARLHVHAVDYDPPPGFRVRSYDRPFPFSNPDFPFVEPPLLEDPANLPAEHRDVYARALDRTRRALERTWAREPARITHNDLHPWNLITGDPGPALLDFEDIMWGHPVQDIGTLFYYLHLRPNPVELRDAFRAGYEEVAPWPEHEPGEIDAYRVARALYLVNWVVASENPDLRKIADEYVGRVAPRLEPGNG